MTEVNHLRTSLTTSIKIEEHNYGLYIYYNKTNAAAEENRLFDHVDRLEKEIIKKMKPVRHNRYTKYYTIEEAKEGEIRSFERNYDKIAEACELLGVFCFLSTEQGMSPAEALELYKRRDEIEKIYDVSKNELDADRFLVQTDQTAKGKHFVHFLALILWADLQRKVRQCDNKPEKTIERMLCEIKKIKYIEYESGRTLAEPLTRKQKDILDCCGIDKNTFVERIVAGVM